MERSRKLIPNKINKFQKGNILPYGYTIRNLYSVENPKFKGIKGNTAKMYDSRTIGPGIDVKSGYPNLYSKAKAGKLSKLYLDELAVTHLRHNDEVIRDNYADIYGKEAADTLSFGPRFLAALARYQQGNVRKGWDDIHKAMAAGDSNALKNAILKVTPADHAYRRRWIKNFLVYPNTPVKKESLPLKDSPSVFERAYLFLSNLFN